MKSQKSGGVKNGVNRKQIIRKHSKEMHFYITSPALIIKLEDIDKKT